ncbi:hypothetical protein G7007_06305 [Pseudomonas entomophila]|uniref:hypothetical protein n=1 Tax=Pseudomonas entomophila TaxID=312306 RepID=UPI0015E2E704|nr:hypothetical protein [Pseudomonas entomophila]MBA1192473.1 hypothetical protein [Pseudomonas entomophila]
MKMMVPSDEYPEKYWLKYDHEKNPSHLEFILTKALELDTDFVAFSIQKKISLAAFKKFDFLYSDGPDLVSGRVSRILRDNCPDDVQLVPAIIEVNDQVITDYAVLNVLKFEEAFDLSSCVYGPLIKSIPDGPKRFRKIVLQDKVSDAQFFRASENRESIVLSNSIAQLFKDASVKGVELVSVLEGL